MLAALSCLVAAPALAVENGTQAEAEKLLTSACENFLAAIADVNETQWSFQAEGHRHTIGELAEHAALSTNDLLRVIQKALESGADPHPEQGTYDKVTVLRRVMLNKDDPPDKFKPSGKLLTKADVLEFFPQAQRKALTLAHSVANADKVVYKHPSAKIGRLNGVQWFYYIALLVQSHTAQIEAIKQDPKYPKS